MRGAMFPLPPHPMKAPPMETIKSNERYVFHRRRRPGIPKISSADMATLPPMVNIRFNGFSALAT